jgi:hypothetical protein
MSKKESQYKIISKKNYCGGGRNREVAQTMYTYVSKCKNDKIKKKKP